MKLTTSDRKALDLLSDGKPRRVSTSGRHARIAIHPATAGRLVRLGLAAFDRQHSLSLSERPRTYINLTEAGRKALVP
jgi:hypothetical protein